MVVGLNRNDGALFVDSLWELILPNKLFVVFVDWSKNENLGVSLCVVGVLKNEAWDDGLDPPNNEFWGDWNSLRDEESLEKELVVGVEGKFDVDWSVPAELLFSLPNRLTDSCLIPKEGVVDPPNIEFLGDWKSLRNDESLEEELVVGETSKFDVVWAVPAELSFSLSGLSDCCGIPKENSVGGWVDLAEPNNPILDEGLLPQSAKALSIYAMDGLVEDEVLVGCWNSLEVFIDSTGDLVPFKEKEKLDWTVDGVEEKGEENVVVVDCAVVLIVKTDVVGVFVLIEKENGLMSADAEIEACSLKYKKWEWKKKNYMWCKNKISLQNYKIWKNCN